MKAFHLLPILPVLLSACAGTQNTTALHDGVYDKPSYEPVVAAAPAPDPAKPTDDYYDPNAASQYQHSYYDRAYNDPYYYNYGRFGFGTGLNYGHGSGSNYGSNWNMGYGYGSQGYDPWGSSWNNGWSSPYGGYGSPYGGYGSPYGGYGYPYGGYGSPYGGCCGSGYWNDPWNNGYNGYPGYGYYGYGGGCWSCYQPIVVCGSPGVVAHRPSLGSGGGGSGTGGGTDGSASMDAPHLSYARSMVSLRPAAMRVLRPDLYATRPLLMDMPAGQRTDHLLILERNAPPREANGRDNSGRVREGNVERIETPVRNTGGGDGGGSGGRTVNEHRPR